MTCLGRFLMDPFKIGLQFECGGNIDVPYRAWPGGRRVERSTERDTSVTMCRSNICSVPAGSKCYDIADADHDTGGNKYVVRGVVSGRVTAWVKLSVVVMTKMEDCVDVT